MSTVAKTAGAHQRHEIERDASAIDTAEKGMKYSANRAVLPVRIQNTAAAKAKASRSESFRRLRHPMTNPVTAMATAPRSQRSHCSTVKGRNSGPSSIPSLDCQAFLKRTSTMWIQLNFQRF